MELMAATLVGKRALVTVRVRVRGLGLEGHNRSGPAGGMYGTSNPNA